MTRPHRPLHPFPAAGSTPQAGASAASAIDGRTACPCGAGPAYAACCGRYHAGPLHLAAPDAQHLMRSRYSAFVRGDAAYLLATWHPDTRPAALSFEPGLRWLGLQVRAARDTGPGQAEVEFVARSKQAGRAHRLHETSRFVRQPDGAEGRWLYVDGTLHGEADPTPAATAPRRA